MKAYSEYKASGVEWLGDIPRHWDFISSKWLYDNIGSGSTPLSGEDKYYKDGTVNWLQTGDLNDNIVSYTAKKITDYALVHKGLKIYPVGSLVIAMYGATIAKLGLLDIETTVNQACCVLCSSLKVLSKYSFYYFLAAQNELISLASGGGQPNISQSIISSFKILVPSLEEQTIIARYLDVATAKIDKLIAEKQKQVNDLLTYRTSLISEAVTRGLNPDAPLRKSDIDWIGDIPRHWDSTKAKYYVEIKSGDPISKEEIQSNGKYPIYGGGEIIGYTNQINILKGTIIIGRVGAKCGCVRISECDSWATDNALIVTTNQNSKYLNHLLEAANLNRLNESNAQPLITATKIKEFQIPIPPLSEQQAIADYLDTKTTKIDKLIAELEAQLTDLATYRQAVITEAVTGKVDVRNWNPQK